LDGEPAVKLDILGDVYAEWQEAQREDQPRGDGLQYIGFPHARLSARKAKAYALRAQRLVDDVLSEAPDPNGTVFGLGIAFFASPAYMQVDAKSRATPATSAQKVRK
jgi:hypothetical protein